MIRHTMYLILFLCGLLHADEWYTASPMHSARGGAAAVLYGDYIYVFGGKSIDGTVLNTVECFDIDNDEWDTLAVPPFQHARYNAAALVYDNKIYLIGGREDDDVIGATEIYDPVQNSWTEAQKMRKEREGFSGALLNNRIYAIGGQEEQNKLIDEIEWYNPDQNSWLEAVFDLPFPRAAHYAAARQDTFYMFGGYYYGLTRSAYKAIPTDSGYVWIQNGELCQGKAYGATAVVGEEIFLIGGEISTGKTNKVDVYNVTNGTYASCQPLSSTRSGMAAVTAKDSLIYVIGGFETINNEPVNTVEYYSGKLTAIEKTKNLAIPENHILIQGYPNPFNSQINFRVKTLKHDTYDLSVYNIRGQQIHHIFRGNLNPGEHQFTWQASPSIASGLYLLVIQSNEMSEKFKAIYVK